MTNPKRHDYLRRLDSVLTAPMPGSDLPALRPPYMKYENGPGNYGLRDRHFLRLCRGVPDEMRLDALTFVLNTLPQLRAVLATARDVLDTPADRLPDLAMLRAAMEHLDRAQPFVL